MISFREAVEKQALMKVVKSVPKGHGFQLWLNKEDGRVIVSWGDWAEEDIYNQINPQIEKLVQKDKLTIDAEVGLPSDEPRENWEELSPKGAR